MRFAPLKNFYVETVPLLCTTLRLGCFMLFYYERSIRPDIKLTAQIISRLFYLYRLEIGSDLGREPPSPTSPLALGHIFCILESRIFFLVHLLCFLNNKRKCICPVCSRLQFYKILYIRVGLRIDDEFNLFLIYMILNKIYNIFFLIL